MTWPVSPVVDQTGAVRLCPLLIAVVLAAGCSTDPTGSSSASGPANAVSAPAAASGDQTAQQYPDVLEASAARTDGDTWQFSATLSSPYDSPQRYADAWRVLTANGVELGVRELAHDHAGEQPFTRALSGVVVPADVDTVIIQGRDLINGWGGATVEVQLPR